MRLAVPADPGAALPARQRRRTTIVPMPPVAEVHAWVLLIAAATTTLGLLAALVWMLFLGLRRNVGSGRR
ncbi:hypothetical protein CLV29_3038 [Naumannella halotolerans]|uniref:Uncharacterized protein n=1 Tax=Naumannella halotolerans TaxID=993414 RepID=A0A4R7IZ86_9ACTN|nr:hypothetical protein CLV29_3038 [Naumannella halotolerans]